MKDLNFSLLSKLLSLTAIMVTFSISITALGEGGSNEGGGKGVRCGNQLMALEVYEAKLRGVTIPKPLGSLEKEMARLVENRINTKGYISLSYIENEFTYLSPFIDASDSEKENGIHYQIAKKRKLFNATANEKLSITNDARLPVMLPGCEVVQIFVLKVTEEFFTIKSDGAIRIEPTQSKRKTTTIEYNPIFLNMLDSFNLTILLDHETLYSRQLTNKYLDGSELKKLTSDEVRASIVNRLIGYQVYFPKLKDIREKSLLSAKCYGGFRDDTKNWAHELDGSFQVKFVSHEQNGVNGLLANFEKFNKNEVVPYNMVVFIPHLILTHKEDTIKSEHSDETINRIVFAYEDKEVNSSTVNVSNFATGDS